MLHNNNNVWIVKEGHAAYVDTDRLVVLQEDNMRLSTTCLDDDDDFVCCVGRRSI